LGHIISKEGIAVDPENTKAIKGWKTIKSVTEVRSFENSSSHKFLAKKGEEFSMDNIM
jgi:hypothetical protein